MVLRWLCSLSGDVDSHDPDVLWVRVVKALYGIDRRCYALISSATCKDPCNNVIHNVAQLMDICVDLHKFLSYSCGKWSGHLFMVCFLDW